MSTLYENIRFYCDKAGITGAKLCADSGVSKSTLTSLKSGRTKKISTDNLSKMAARLGVSVDDLLGSEQKQKSSAPSGAELDPRRQEAWELLNSLSDEKLEKVLVILRAAAEM